MKDRPPTEFEMKVLRGIEKHNRVNAGNKSVQYSAAAHRLERLGLVGYYFCWFLTAKGKAYLRELKV